MISGGQHRNSRGDLTEEHKVDDTKPFVDWINNYDNMMLFFWPWLRDCNLNPAGRSDVFAVDGHLEMFAPDKFSDERTRKAMIDTFVNNLGDNDAAHHEERVMELASLRDCLVRAREGGTYECFCEEGDVDDDVQGTGVMELGFNKERALRKFESSWRVRGEQHPVLTYLDRDELRAYEKMLQEYQAESGGQR